MLAVATLKHSERKTTPSIRTTATTTKLSGNSIVTESIKMLKDILRKDIKRSRAIPYSWMFKFMVIKMSNPIN